MLEWVSDTLSTSDEPITLLLPASPSRHVVQSPHSVQAGNHNRPSIAGLHYNIMARTRGAPWALVDGLVMFGRLHSPSGDLGAAHDDAHERVQKTLHRRNFNVPQECCIVQD
jgi:hypothetical protein